MTGVTSGPVVRDPVLCPHLPGSGCDLCAAAIARRDELAENDAR